MADDIIEKLANNDRWEWIEISPTRRKGTIGVGKRAKQSAIWLQKNDDRISAELEGVIGVVAGKSSPKPITELSQSDLNRLWDQATVHIEEAKKKATPEQSPQS